jgi:tetratricopeptide (TPR) repeat protein
VTAITSKAGTFSNDEPLRALWDAWIAGSNGDDTPGDDGSQNRHREPLPCTIERDETRPAFPVSRSTLAPDPDDEAHVGKLEDAFLAGQGLTQQLSELARLQLSLKADPEGNTQLLRRLDLLSAEATCRSESMLQGLEALTRFELLHQPLTLLEALRIHTARVQTHWILWHCMDMDSVKEAVLPDHPLVHYHDAVSAMAWGIVGPARAQFQDLQRRIDRTWPPDAVAGCAFSCAVALFLEGDFDESILQFDHAAAVWAGVPNRQDCLATIKDYLGRITFLSGDPEGAADCFRAALEGWNTVFDRPSSQLADLEFNLAISLEACGRHGEAVELHRSALRQREQIWWSTHPDVRQSLRKLANLEWVLGNFESAWQFRMLWWQRNAEAGHPLPDGLTLGTRPPADLEEALRHVEELGLEFESADHSLSGASCLLFLRPGRTGLHPELFPRTDTTDTLGIPLGAIADSFPSHEGELPPKISLVLRRDHQLLEQLHHAGPYLSDRAILGMQRMRRRSLDRVLSYCAVGQLPADRALHHLAVGRGLLLEELPQRRKGHKQGHLKVIELKKQLQECEARFFQIVQEARRQENVTTSAAFRSAKLRHETLSIRLRQASLHAHDPGTRSQVDIARIQQSLGPGEALVSFVRFNFHGSSRSPGRRARDMSLEDIVGVQPAYLAFIIRGDRPPRAVMLGPAEEVDERIRDWRTQIRRMGSAFSCNRELRKGLLARSGEALRILVWDPLELDPEQLDRVYLVTDGDLAGVPFAALPIQGSTVLQDLPLELHLLTREQDLLLERPAGSWKSILCLGHSGPDQIPDDPYDNWGLCALPHSTIELDLIERVWDLARRTGYAEKGFLRLEGPNATREHFLETAPSHDVIHLATHCVRLDKVSPRGTGGFLDILFEDHPLLTSALMLSGNDHGPVVITGQDLATLSLDATRLVVLSSCDSGGGVALDGVGMLGLQRACRIAGVRYSVVSLWPVEDSMSARWMELFYTSLLLERLSPPDAVASANRALRQQLVGTPGWADPGTWSAFVCIG